MKNNSTKTILVTGAGGYIGSILVKHFLDKGHKVKALDRYFFGQDVLKNCYPKENLTIIQDDTRYFSGSILKGVDSVIDLAALSNDAAAELDPKITEEINIEGPIRVAGLAKRNGVKRYIFASSCSVYGQSEELSLSEKSKTKPLSLYAKAKVIVENEVLAMADENFTVTCPRNATCYGYSPRMRFDLVVNLMALNAYLSNKITVTGGGLQWRPFVHIYDVSHAYEMILDADHKLVQQEIFNIGSNEQNFQMITLAKIVKKVFKTAKIEVLNDYLELRNYNVSFEKVKKVLGFKPLRSVIDGASEIKKALENGETENKIETITSKYYRHLIETDNMLSEIKYNNKLF